MNIYLDYFLSAILGLPKSLYFNFKYLPFKDALKFPIIVSHRVLLYSTKGSISIKKPIKFGMIRIGFGHVSIFDKYRSRTILDIYANANILFKGKTQIGYGSKLAINGEFILGDNFGITAESEIICNKKITFGDNCLVSWNTLIMDTDFHKIKNINGNIINTNKEIVFGNNVWVGCRCTILKGSSIGNNVVIAANTLIHKHINGDNQIIGGNPATILKQEISWEE